jgi:hypothetical protein
LDVLEEWIVINGKPKMQLEGVADAVARNFGKLPENVQNLLFKLADNEDAAGDVANAVAWNFGKLPENVQNLSFKLGDNKLKLRFLWKRLATRRIADAVASK